MIDALTILEATQKAAVACYNHIGKGMEKLADKAAVDAMREAFNKIDFSARIVIGEGERDEAPMLYIGEKIGLNQNSPCQYDIAVDPLEGTTICAKNLPGSLSVLAITESGGMLHAPDVYMDKIASYCPDIDLDIKIADNLKNISLFSKKEINELNVIILDRPRHQEIISKVREAGAKVTLISDGDIAAVIAVALKQADLYIGIGGAPEGVLAAAALKTLGGQFLGRLIFNSTKEEEKARKTGIIDLGKKYQLNELVSKDSIFCATGVTTGNLLQGVTKTDHGFSCSSLILDSNKNQKIHLNSLSYNKRLTVT